MKPRLQELYETKIRTDLQKDLEITNVMNIPKIERISLNIGIGDAHSSPKKLEAAINEMAQITGQQPVKTYAKKSIAGFKIREGMVMGCSVSLRRARMYEFLDRLINLSLPRVRDFRGVSSKSFDGRGNYNIGIKEQIIFPEIDFDKIDSVRGMNISIVTSAGSDDHARALLSMFNMPFRK